MRTEFAWVDVEVCAVRVLLISVNSKRKNRRCVTYKVIKLIEYSRRNRVKVIIIIIIMKFY